MCLTKIVNQNRKYRSQRPNSNKLGTRPPEDSPNQIQMISGQWFYRRRFLRIGQKLYKITHNYMKNRGSATLRNINTKFEANTCSGSREEVEKPKKFTPTTTTTTDTG